MTSSGPTQTSSASSPPVSASSHVAPSATRTSAPRMMLPAPEKAANFCISRNRPSEMSPQHSPAAFNRRPSSSSGATRRARRSRSASAEAPSAPVTATAQPGRASFRASGRFSLRPTTVMDRTAGPSIELMSPPAMSTCVFCAKAAIPWYSPVRLSTAHPVGIAIEVSAHEGVAPFAARSPSESASERHPASCALIHPRSKCTPSTNMSQLATVNPPPSSSTAASSRPDPVAR